MITLLHYQGIVQGVGFRPKVWRVAKQLNLVGNVSNNGNGVLVRFWATDKQIEKFRRHFESSPPPLSKIDHVFEQKIQHSDKVPTEFKIITSEATQPMTGIAPDAATCDDCINDITQAENRRFQYPFTNCTNCGPRLSIIKAIPYDRANTSMRDFNLCPACTKEYSDPTTRRYHAQPNACPVCGPEIELVSRCSQVVQATNLNLPLENKREDEITTTAKLLIAGRIIAIKGIGGFHLVCDATNSKAVQTLRQRKVRKEKPFALMATNINMIQNYCELSAQEIELLQSSAAPIILLPGRAITAEYDETNTNAIAKDVAPGTNLIGFMLPYSPLHHLLLAKVQRPLVMTSGNKSHQPQCISNQQALENLAQIADDFLFHNRNIVNRVDDSVIRFIAGKPKLFRRARGFAPAPIQLHSSFKDLPPVLSLGGELKNTICLLQQGRAIVSQHLGDLEDASTSDEFERTIQLYQQLYQFKPKIIAIDQHPDYRSSRIGIQLAKLQGNSLKKIQHHHAHLAAVLAENRWPIDGKKVLGICFDGLGFGNDGTLWGGELMLFDYREYQRLGCLMPVNMPGASKAITQPWRNLWSQLSTHFNWDQLVSKWGQISSIKILLAKPVSTLSTMREHQINSPLSSSAGRLFDAVAAVLNINFESIDYEGQAAIGLQNLAENSTVTFPYPFALEKNGNLWKISAKPMWVAMLQDLARQKNKADVARHFHLGLANACVELVLKLKQEFDFETVALSGGVMQNKLFVESLMTNLKPYFKLLHHAQVPSNDGGISLGQAVISAALAQQQIEKFDT